MNVNRSENRINVLQFTYLSPPNVKENFFEKYQIIVAWNGYKKDVFIHSLLYCFDYYIYIRNKQFTCLVWMIVPRNPHHKGNQYHTMYYRYTRIMLGWQLVEGTDRPKESRSTELKRGTGLKTIELMWRMKKIKGNKEYSYCGQ